MELCNTIIKNNRPPIENSGTIKDYRTNNIDHYGTLQPHAPLHFAIVWSVVGTYDGQDCVQSKIRKDNAQGMAHKLGHRPRPLHKRTKSRGQDTMFGPGLGRGGWDLDLGWGEEGGTLMRQTSRVDPKHKLPLRVGNFGKHVPD